MYGTEKNAQVNFKTNNELLERAKKVFASKNLDMTTSFNMFLEYVVQENDLPFPTADDLERKRLLLELKAQSDNAYINFMKGNYVTLEEVKKNFGL